MRHHVARLKSSHSTNLQKPPARLAAEQESGPRACRRHLTLKLWLLVGLLLVGGLASAGQSARAIPASTESLAPGAPSVLLINQKSPNWPKDSDQRGRQVEMLLRHFTPSTTKISEDQYADDQLFGFDYVVVVGNDAGTPLPFVLLEDLARADQPVLWLGYGLDRLPVDIAATYGFSPSYAVEEDAPSWVEYRGQRYTTDLVASDYLASIRIASSSVQLLATYGGGRAPVPYILRGGNLWYVNGLPRLDTDYPDRNIGGPPTKNLDAPPHIFADVLHDFFGTSITESQQALIRLEDVSVHVDPDRLIEIVNYLHSQQVPFALGLIPAQRYNDGSVVGLSERPKFVKALRYAQDHGGTIVLHGYNHTFGSGEDYEFWDIENNAPLSGETWDTYAHKVEDGIRILRDHGLEPRLWETPHYAGSPLAYQVFSHYFSHAIENREPVEWLPYPAGPDEYGQMLIPETIGYINPAEGWTVDAQLERADLLRIVRDGWAVGFYHPASIPQSELESLVKGLRQQGYTFVDLRTLPTEVRYDYRPNLLRRTTTWVMVDLGLSSPWYLLGLIMIVAVWSVPMMTRDVWRGSSASVGGVTAKKPSPRMNKSTPRIPR